jgi:hypothetical protein
LFEKIFDENLLYLTSLVCKYVGMLWVHTGNTKGGNITVPFTSYLTGLDESVLQIKTKNFSCHTANTKQVKQEVNDKVIFPPLVFPECIHCMDVDVGRKRERELMHHWDHGILTEGERAAQLTPLF